MSSRLIGCLGLTLLGLAASGRAVSPQAPAAPHAPASPVEWIVEDGARLTLRLVREEGGRVCGGELTVDATARTVRFEGAPGAIGCRTPLQASFEQIEALRMQSRQAGFVLEVPTKGVTWVLLPLPHFRWFHEQRRLTPASRDLENRLNALGVLRGPDNDPVSLGGSSAPELRHVELPPVLVADTQRAVDLVREAMGRTPAPEEMLREILQGRPLDAGLSELVQEPGAFASSPVRVRAQLVRGDSASGLRLEGEGTSIAIEAAPGAEARFALASAWVDRDIELVGRLRRRDEAPGNEGAGAEGRPAEHVLEAWECIGPDAVAVAEGVALTLSELQAGMKQHEGEVVRVVGRFRGRNNHGDLPPASRRSMDDWVIKSGRAAVWVTGHKPGGEGWNLDLDTPGSLEWLEVVGRPRVREGVTYLRALKVSLVAPPPGARVVPSRRLLGRPQQPPTVVFSLPLEGEAMGATTRIVVQFDRNMDDESFKDRVRLREDGGGLVPVRLVYDEARRSLVISPLRSLPAGRPVRVELLAGIVDLEGMPLGPRPGRVGQGEVVDVLRYGSES